MEKQNFIGIIDNFLSNIELEYVDINGQLQRVYLEKFLKTTYINLNDLPNDTIEKIFVTKVEFVEIIKEYYRIVTKYITQYLPKKYTITSDYVDDISLYKHIFELSRYTLTSQYDYFINDDNYYIYVVKDNGIYKQYDKVFLNNTYLKFNDYLFFNKYFNLDIKNIDIYYPIKIISKKDYSEISKLFNIDIMYQNILTTNNTKDVVINNNQVSYIRDYLLNKVISIASIQAEFYNNFYYNFYQNCSIFNIIKYFIYGLLEYKQLELNQFFNIAQEKNEIEKINENIDITVSQNMIQRFNYDIITDEELSDELKPIPNDDLYNYEQHIILQGIFEDIQKFCNNIQKYISGATWNFDNIDYNKIEDIDKKISYLENILKTYNNNVLDLRGYNSYFKTQKRNIDVGDSDKLNILNLTESENNFLHIEKMLNNNNYPLFAKLNLINQIKQTMALFLNTIKNLADNKKFYDESVTEVLLPNLRSAYKELAKAVASQEQPLSFGNPNYNSNPNEEPFKSEGDNP